MLVTKIERQKRHLHRVNIFLDNEFAFGLHEEVLAKTRIRVGDDLTQQTIELILTHEEFTLAKQQALRFIGYRMRSERELRVKLIEKEFDPATVDNVVHHLQLLGIINDKIFAEAFIHDTQLRKPAGRRLLVQKLRLKGIAPPVIDDVLNEKVTRDEEQILAFNSAQHLMKRYRASRKNVDEEKQRQRISQFLARRGFGWDTIAPVLKQLFSSTSFHQGG